MCRVNAYACWTLLLCALAPLAAHAQYEVDRESPLWARALIDIRIGNGDRPRSWIDHGRGKLPYGGDSQGDAATRAGLARLAVQIGASLPGGVRAQLQANVQPDVADGYDPWLVEAFLRKEWGAEQSTWALQAGIMGPPFSLEHAGPAWTPEYSLTSSALNTWLWEEISLAGLEGEWRGRLGDGMQLGAIIGVGFGTDRLARALALRGWVIGDHVGAANGDLPLPNGTRQEIFHERDDRPAAYALLTLADAENRGALKLGYFDNGGDLDEPGVWRTRIATVGAIWSPVPAVELVSQYLRGKALVRSPANDSSLRAFYVLLSHHRREHRISVRYDEFRVRDLDLGNPTAEMGDAITLGYSYEWGLRSRVGLEYTWLESIRPVGVPLDLRQDGWQVSYRFRY